jgi:hypothetical protein
MGTTTTYVHIYKPGDSEVFDEQLVDNANSDIVDAAILVEHNLILAHSGAVAPHAGHAVLTTPNIFQALQTILVSADSTGLLFDTPALVAAGTLTGSRATLRARSFDTSAHTRDFIWRARATTTAGAGVLELLSSLDGGAPVLLWSVSAAGIQGGAVPPMELLFTNTALVLSSNYDLTNSPGVLFVFNTTAGTTVTLPDARTAQRPITIYGPTAAGNTNLASIFGGIFGGSANLTTGAIQNGIVTSGDSFVYKSDGTNWRS